MWMPRWMHNAHLFIVCLWINFSKHSRKKRKVNDESQKLRAREWKNTRCYMGKMSWFPWFSYRKKFIMHIWDIQKWNQHCTSHLYRIFVTMFSRYLFCVQYVYCFYEWIMKLIVTSASNTSGTLWNVILCLMICQY